jgi:hypothetical protein
VKRAATLAFVATLAGCGGSDGDFSSRGNEICNELRSRVAAVQQPKADPTVIAEDSRRGREMRARLARYSARNDRIAREELPRLRALEPPARLRAKRDDFFAAIDEQRRLAVASQSYQTAIVAAVRSKNQKRLEAAVAAAGPTARRELAVGRRLDADARALGWHACAR